MTAPLPGLSTCKLLRTSARTRVYEAERDGDGRRVLAKVFRVDELGVEARVRHEFRLLQQLEVPRIVRALALERLGDELILLLEYVEGHNLAHYARGRPLALPDFLAKARSLVETLARVHARGIVHRDIKPSNILVEEHSGEVYLADFGISVLLEDQRRFIDEPEVLEGTLPYVSPEQTGRTRREVDFRSDLYSLGVTFYELLLGRRPFEASAPLELIHAHLARRATPPLELRPELPERLSAIVMQLLEKAPEHRYQSALGLLGDLDRLIDGLAAGDPQPSFPLGELDRPTTLQLPRRLYGRARELERLAEQLRAMVGARERRLVLLAGEPGLGKSALIRELDDMLLAEAPEGGYVAIGRFEQAANELPYAGFIAAFDGLLDRLLTESDDRLARWRARLRRALGPIAAVVGGLIPNLALVLGDMPDLPELDPGELRIRVQLAFVRLFAGFADATPLVFVLDDFQWADPASVELLRALVLDREGAPLVLLVAQRDDESAREHPSLALFAELDALGAGPRRIDLAPLDHDALVELLADVLRRPADTLDEFARLVSRKTGNNPLFVQQFLIHLAELGLLEPSAAGWVWDAETIARAGVPDDVLGMMRARLARLPAREQLVLRCAACIGARFETSVLAEVCELPADALAESLHRLEAEGLIDREALGHRFAHARLEEAARALLDASERPRVHGRIGEILLARQAGLPLGDRVFAIVDQLEAAGEPEDRRALARLEVEAGQRMFASAAWTRARHYFEQAVGLLADEIAAANAGRGHDELAFAANYGLAQSLGLVDEVERAMVIFEQLLAWPLSPIQYGEVVARRVKILVRQQRPGEATAAGLAGLARCGLVLPARCSLARAVFWILRAWWRCKHRSLDEWLAVPEARDERSIAAVRIISALKVATYLTDINLFATLSGIDVWLSSRELHRSTPFALAALSLPVAVGLRDPIGAGRLCDVALQLCERPAMAGARGDVEVAAVMSVWPTSRPWRGSVRLLDATIQRLEESGDFELGGYGIGVGLGVLMESGAHLGDVIERGRVWLVDAERWGSGDMWLTLAHVLRLAEALVHVGESPGPPLVDHALCDTLGGSAITHAVVSVSLAEGAWLLGDLELAGREVDRLADDFERQLGGLWYVPRFATFAALVDGTRFDRCEDPRERARLREHLRRYLRVLTRWAAGSPENFGAAAAIARAELERAEGRMDAALAHYERASSLASGQRLHQLEASACLRSASLAESLARPIVALGSTQLAMRAFQRWGAKAVVARLERERQLGELGSTSEGVRESTSIVSTGGTPSSLDLALVLGTMHSISEDLRLDEVVRRVLDSAIRNAGADRGVLLLEHEGVITIVAEGDATLTASYAEPLALADARARLPMSALHYVLRTGAPLLLDDAREDPRFAGDPHVVASGVRSLLAMPIVKQSERVGALLLENHLHARAFPAERLEVLRFLVTQAASALDNARLYDALQRGEARWRSLVAGAPDSIALIDREGVIEFVNHLVGVADPSVLIGRPVLDFLDPSVRPAWQKTLADVLESGETRELELCVAIAGEQRWLQTRVARIDAQRGKLLTIATDVSERKHFEAQVRQQQRLESIGTLASGVAHEINNPVQGIMNYAELIADDPLATPVIREFAQEIGGESERVATIVRNLLTFSRQERDTERELVAPHELVEAALTLIQVVIRKDGIDLRVEVPRELPSLRCRSQQIRQVLMNLVTNARDALNERYVGDDARKVLTIRATTLEVDAREWLRFSVQDEGPGIPEPIRARIFDPFFTTKERERGTGLGLSVSHGIALEHGGELSVESELGRGTTFHLTLPLPLEDE
ncbi:protein kinase domain-containing protein [Nannocystaceae bacterium ST9]